MVKKKVESNSGEKTISNTNVSVAELSFVDLYALYQFVSSNYNKHFGVAQVGEKIVLAKMKEVEGELYNRAYGANPFVKKVQNAIVIDGQKPEDVIATLPPAEKTLEDVEVEEITQNKNFIVADVNIEDEDIVQPRFVVAKNKE